MWLHRSRCSLSLHKGRYIKRLLHNHRCKCSQTRITEARGSQQLRTRIPQQGHRWWQQGLQGGVQLRRQGPDVRVGRASPRVPTLDFLPHGVEGDRLPFRVRELPPGDAAFLRCYPVRFRFTPVREGASAPGGRGCGRHAVRAARRRFPPAEAALRSVLRRFARDA